MANQTDYARAPRAKLPRPSTEHQRLALKSACRGAIDLAGGVTAFALKTALEAPALSKAMSAQDDAHWLRLDVALDADMEAGAPVITGALAGMLGYDLVARGPHGLNEPALPERAGLLPPAAVAELARELADVTPALLAAQADGRLDAAERRAVLAEIDQAVKLLTAARAALAV